MKLDKLTEATVLALRGKLDESFNSKLDVNAIAEFLKGAVNDLVNTEYTCTWYTLDKDLAIFVGWTEGYDADDPDYIHAKDDPTFVIATKIASTHEYMKTDLDWLVQPYYEDGEVCDTEITLTETSNFKEDAEWFIKSYEDIRKALDNGELLLENKKLKEARNPENDEINNKIKATINGSKKYIKDLEDAGLEVDGRTVKSNRPNTMEYDNKLNKQDINNLHPDTDYYNKLTKKRPLDREELYQNEKGFRSNYSSETDIDRGYDKQGVNNAVPKRFKTGYNVSNGESITGGVYGRRGINVTEPYGSKAMQDYKKISKDIKIDKDYIQRRQSDIDELQKNIDKSNRYIQDTQAEIDEKDKERKDIINNRKKELQNKRKAEARSHKEDNEKVAPRGDFEKVSRYVKNSPYNEPDVPKRAKIGNGKPNDKGEVWGVVDKDLIDTYEKSTPDIERYKEYKADAERERNNAKYYNALAKQSDDRASDIVRDRKLDRANRMLKGKSIFDVKEAKKVESKDTPLDSQAYWAYVLGYDLLHKKLRSEGPECDVTFEEAWKIAGDFMNSEEFKDKSKSGYDALVNYLKNKKLMENKKQEGRFNPNSENPEIRMKNYKLMLKRALGTDYEVVGKQGYRYYSGFIKNNKNGKCAYYSINQDWNGKDETDNILIRTAKDFKDYTGGSNRYTDIDNFVKDISRLTESVDESLKAYTVTVSDEENQHSFQFYAEKDKTLDDVFNEIYNYVIF